jgi:hypothetical protein
MQKVYFEREDYWAEFCLFYYNRLTLSINTQSINQYGKLPNPRVQEARIQKVS